MLCIWMADEGMIGDFIPVGGMSVSDAKNLSLPVIEEGNWLSLDQAISRPGLGFDAVICLGNSFAHLPDFKGDQSDQRLALRNIAGMVKPGGMLIIDHRNYDYILNTGCAPQGKNIYYKSDLTQDISTSILWVNKKPHMVTLDYTVQVPASGELQPEMRYNLLTPL
ncbi:glycine N-methyltransferase-like [Bufo bufo]|uniref:glycine N-methyltransferase-like n=1 Tax=Bufo bufo TaxID=8384 RepID=UPI001ABEA079|nr:glycine N-methyltransferase-like [Bufo bufo]